MATCLAVWSVDFNDSYGNCFENSDKTGAVRAGRLDSDAVELPK